MKRNQTSQTQVSFSLVFTNWNTVPEKNNVRPWKAPSEKINAEMFIYRRKGFVSWLCNPCKRIQGEGWEVKGHLYRKYSDLIVMLTYFLALENNKIFAELRNITEFNAERMCWQAPQCQGCKGRMVKHPVEPIFRIHSYTQICIFMGGLKEEGRQTEERRLTPSTRKFIECCLLFNF